MEILYIVVAHTLFLYIAVKGWLGITPAHASHTGATCGHLLHFWNMINSGSVQETFSFNTEVLNKINCFVCSDFKYNTKCLGGSKK